MATEFKLPELGENIQAGDVVSVLVAEGDTIDIDDPVLEIETDKATIEVPSSVSGTIKTIHVQTGDTIEVGQVILTTENGADETAEPEPEAAEPEEAEPEPEEQQQPEAEPEKAPEPETPEPEAEQAPTTGPQTVEVKLPVLGENIESGEVVSVLVSVGDTIKVDQGIIEIETDKATAEVPSSVGGLVKEIHVKEGDTIEVDQLILTLETDAVAPAAPAEPARETPAEARQPEAKPEEQAQPEEKEEKKEAEKAPAKVQPTAFSEVPSTLAARPEQAAIPAAPNVRRMAREIGVNITQVSGTGPEGRISMGDVKRHARESFSRLSTDGAGRALEVELPDFSRWGPVETESMSNIRKATARHMELSWTTIPHVTQFDKADIGELEKLRKRFAGPVEEAGGKLTITAILLKVAAAALKQFPKFNASVDLKNEEIIYKKYYHIGVAVDTERGLLVPVIRDVDQKNIQELAIELGEVAEKARNRKLKPEDMQGGTFTLTNLGGIGGTNFTPIVNSPEVAILGIARGSTEPVFKDGQFEPRLMLPLSLSYDHHLIDGADGARFLRWIVRALEEPFMLALQGW